MQQLQDQVLERVITLGEISVGVIAQAVENVATLRAENGAGMSQLRNDTTTS